jgi:transcriptional regulator with XRE-family HTH domain
MTTTTQTHASIGELLRNWRRRRRRSQLDLALDVGISTRHLSFVETGRSHPSREMILRLSGELGVGMRESNQLLLAAGYAPVYGETELDAPELAPMRRAVRDVVRGHDPFPALAVDRHWTVVERNDGLDLFLEPIDPALLQAPNAMRIAMHPEGMQPHVANFAQWRSHLLGDLRRAADMSGDPVLADLYDECAAFPFDDDGSGEHDLVPADGEVVTPLRLRHDGQILTFFGIISSFGTPRDITLAELAIESFFPADDDTSEALRRR